ncbi:hypothetical protein [Leptospira ilyithenensis]|uniref:hypothetical protein n=1 Tax=Leptospira ilyithenensis TaxID=2484901 RepID=UPI001FE52470|nr:hypothetical protein [Leptospira ilyithenensis]
MEKTESSGKKKKVFKITRAGLNEFKRWMESSVISSNEPNEMLFKFFSEGIRILKN